MIVYENLGNMTAKEILERHGDELRIEPRILLYEAESDTGIYLSKMFDIPDLTVRQGGEHIRTLYPLPEQIDDRLKGLSSQLFGKCDLHPYSEWLALQRRAGDEEITRIELKRLLNACKRRVLSPQFKQEMKQLVQAM